MGLDSQLTVSYSLRDFASSVLLQQQNTFVNTGKRRMFKHDLIYFVSPFGSKGISLISVVLVDRDDGCMLI